MNPLHYDGEKVRSLLDQASTLNSLSERIDFFSSSFVDCPYKVSPLVGSSSTEEQVSVPLDCFDCVTLVETVLAAAFSKNEEQFLDYLVRLRYHHGKVDWLERNHYSVDWIERNEESGFVRNITPEDHSATEERTLSLLENYPVNTHRIHYLPVSELELFLPQLKTGDLMYFGTMRKNLDVSHVGFIICQGEQYLLRHSTKSKGCTLDEPLHDFLERFGETPGVLVVRPLPPS